MGTLNDLFQFESHNFGSIWDKIKEDPERLLYGAVDPFSTELWNRITGSNYEPLVNQLGGPMGSGWAGLGENGGVYASAEQKGINTKHSKSSHDVAEIIAAIYGGSAAGDALGGLFSGGGSAAGGSSAGSGASGGGLLSGGDAAALDAASASAGMSGTSGVSASSGMGMNATGGGTNWMGMAQQGMGLLGSASGGQQQQQPAVATSPPPEQQRDSSLRQRVAMQKRIQQLRQKPRKTLAEQQELHELMRNSQGQL